MIAGFYSGYSQIKSETFNRKEGTDTMGTSRIPVFSYETANPKAKKLMKEDFFWDPTAETAPFGNDAGFDAAYGFSYWREENANADPLTYLRELFSRWNYPYFDWNEMDTAKIKTCMAATAHLSDSDMNVIKQSLKNDPVDTTRKLSDAEMNQVVKSTLSNMGIYYLLDQDEAIIGTAFAQLVLEGHVTTELKKLSIIAIQRQMLPVLMNRWDAEYRKTRKAQLSRMLDSIRRCDSVM
jgi:uncharacterized protein YfeS